MMNFIASVASLVSRVMLVAIFLLSAVGNKIMHFNDVVGFMTTKGIRFPNIMLIGAIVFLIAGGISLVLGYKARLGAFLILIFLGLATYYFHDFWNFQGTEKQDQMIQFLKNLSMAGAMLFVMANGPGRWSIDRCCAEECATSKPA